MTCQTPCVYHDEPDEWPSHGPPCAAKVPSLKGWSAPVGEPYDLSRAICDGCDHLSSCHKQENSSASSPKPKE